MNLTLQVCRTVTSQFALTFLSLVLNLRSCRAELAASLKTCIARLLQFCCKLKLLYGCPTCEFLLAENGNGLIRSHPNGLEQIDGECPAPLYIPVLGSRKVLC
ncbi:hypothetical protein AVEN_79638-1 [Araneus ventricosus]|uniref:Secreted protein n=1 Tax=Araneus ventricosus TaxID=182803 RepID=A0A4Y2G4J4_ARAVE|nr:hypothetical protein AVEN_79638-1 [Araneus ventricosus]